MLRLAKLVRHPPSKSRQILVAVVLGVAALLWGIESIWGWPEWATVNKLR